MGIYPVETVETPTRDTYGLPTPTGWASEYTYDAICAACPESCKRVNLVKYAIAAAGDYITAMSQRGVQDTSELIETLYGAMRHLQRIWWLAGGVVDPAATGSISDSNNIRVLSHVGSVITVARAYGPTEDPQSMIFQGAYRRVQPGDTIEYGFRSAQALSFATAVDGVSVDIALDKDLGIPDNTTVQIIRESLPKWLLISPYRAVFTERKIVTGLTGSVLLKDRNGANARIAYPRSTGAGWSQTFVVYGVPAEGDPVDVTSTVLAVFPGAGTRLQFFSVAGAFSTLLNLNGLGYPTYTVEYCVEVPDQENPVTGSHKPTQMMCANSVRDRSNTIADTGEAGTDIENGKHWICDRLHIAGTHTNQYTSWCYDTTCPSFSINVPLFNLYAQFKKVLMDRYTYQRTPAVLPIPVWGVCSNPSVFEVLGKPQYTGDGLLEEKMIWGSGCTTKLETGLMGYLREKTENELLVDECDVSTIQFGAINTGIHNGVLQQGTNPDRRGGVLAAADLADDGSGYTFDMVDTPWRDLHAEAPVQNGAFSNSGGNFEANIQRVRKRKLILNNIDILSSDSTPEFLYSLDGSELTLDINAQGPTFSKTIEGITPTAILDIGSGLWKITFRPEFLNLARRQGINDSPVDKICSAGTTVLPANYQRVYNMAAQHVHGQHTGLIRGDTIKLQNNGYGTWVDYPLTVVWANSHNGAIYSTVDGKHPADAAVLLATVPHPAAPNVPAEYSTDWRLYQDEIIVEIDNATFEALLISAGLITGTTITADVSSVFPPTKTANGNFIASDTDYTIRITHVTVPLSGDPPTSESILAYTYEPALGRITMDTTGWMEVARHCLLIKGKDDEECYMFDRTPTLRAETVQRIPAAIQSGSWIRGPSFLDPIFIGAIDPSVPYPPAQGGYGDVYFYPNLTGPPPTPQCKTENSTWVLEDGVSQDVEWWLRGTGTGAEGMWWDDGLELTVFCGFKGVRVSPYLLGRFTPDDIESAKVDIQILDSDIDPLNAIAFHHDTYYKSPPVPPIENDRRWQPQTDAYFRIALLKISYIGVLPVKPLSIEFLGYSVISSILKACRNKYVTVDLTNLVKSALEDPLDDVATEIVMVICQGGGTDFMTDYTNINDLIAFTGGDITSCWVHDGTGWDATLLSYESDTINYSNLAFRNFKIQLNHDEIINGGRTPHIFTETAGHNNAPPML